MPFPSNLESLLAAGYAFNRSEACPECKEIVEVFATPGKREIIMDPMGTLLTPAVRHYETCNIAPKQKPAHLLDIRMYGVTDPNHQLLAVGWSDGVLACQFSTAKWNYRDVPEDKYLSLRKVPYAYSYFTKQIKGQYPGMKVE